MPILIHRKGIKIPWRLIAMVVGPAVVTGLLIQDPWFTTGGTWRWLRLILLVSWIPALVELERRGDFVYSNSATKWIFRWTLYSLLLVFSVLAVAKVEGWGLIQAHFDGKSWCWLVETNGGEDGYLFTRVDNGPLRSEKLLDSEPYIYSYSIRRIGGQIELSSSEDPFVRLYDPSIRILEFDDRSGDRRRIHKSNNVVEKWNPGTKTWATED